MPATTEFTFLSSDGRSNIYAHKWLPGDKPRAVVQIAHGVSEHILRYDGFARFLAERGFVVVGNDHYGHGKSAASEDELGYFGETGGWEIAVGDMRKLYEQTAQEFPGLPYFLFGHSMGSFLARTYIIRYRAGLAGCILSGTGQQSRTVLASGRILADREVKRRGARYRSERLQNLAFGKYNDAFAPARTVSDWISRDVEVVDKYEQDPLCGYMVTAGLFREMMHGLQYISQPRNLKRMKTDLPVFFISGDMDPVGENGNGVIRVYREFLSAGMTDVTLKLYHEGRHEMLNELNKDQVYKDVLIWLESNIV